MKILFLPKYGPLGASSRYRFLAYLPFLRQRGYEVEVQSLFDDKYVQKIGCRDVWRLGRFILAFLRRSYALLRVYRYDIIVIEKELFPYFPPYIEVLFKVLGKAYIVDYDDALFHQYDRHSSSLVRMLFSNKIGTVMRHAVAVTAGSPYLAEYARRFGCSNIHLIPTVIDLDRYPQRMVAAKSPVFTVVWIGSPSTTPYLKSIFPVLGRLFAGGRGRLRLIGASQLDFTAEWVEQIAWDDATEVQLIQECHVGIMPLPDSPWERGKCGFKLIQYMGCFLPVVASPVGVNEQIVDHGINGYLARTSDEWENALSLLREDAKLRTVMGLHARQKIEKNYSLQAWWLQYVSIIAKFDPTPLSKDKMLQTV